MKPFIRSKFAKNLIDFLPLLILPGLTAIFARSTLVPWKFLFLLAFSIFFGFKWLTLRRAFAKERGPGISRCIGYVFGWVGMNPRPFLRLGDDVPKPNTGEWTLAISKTVLGALIFWVLARQVFPEYPILSGAIGVAGFLTITHFGIYHLLSLIWRRSGVRAKPIMNSPFRATSLGDFWGNRWNIAFRELDHDLVFRPLLRPLGWKGAMITAFLLSGLVHDFTISFPSGGGYGLPTLYFIIQAVGVLIEKSGFGKYIGINHGVRGWVFTFIFAAGPALLLFHPPFMRSVLIPFMRAVHAL